MVFPTSQEALHSLPPTTLLESNWLSSTRLIFTFPVVHVLFALGGGGGLPLLSAESGC